jgi:hypothetical protein
MAVELQQLLQRSRRCAVCLCDFEIGKLPQAGVDDAGWALRHEEFPVTLDDERVKLAARHGGALAEIRQLRFPAGAARGAVGADGAKQALRVLRRADGCAEFHERLVQGRA